jgi:drug/metabolite transporter (DMT)-like permease
MRNWRAYAGLVLAAIFWGASFVATKTLLESLSPATITVFRFGIGLVVIFLLIGPKRVRSAFAAQNLLIALTLGFIGITFHQWLQANGLKTAEATIGSWIVATIPIFVAILGKLFLGESLGFLRIIGIGIASVGALVVIGKGDPFSLMKGSEGVIGDLLFILSAFNWAVFTVISRGVMTRREPRNSGDVGKSKHDRSVAKKDPLGFMFVVMTFGWFFSLIWFILDGGWGDPILFQMRSVIYPLLFLGIASSGLAYAFWYGGLQKVEATQAGVFLYIEPFVTAALAWPILGESMSANAMAGGGAIIFGVWLVNMGSRVKRGPT